MPEGSPDPLDVALRRALDARAPLLDALRGEGTDSYRLFQGGAEGRSGLVVDRYGDLVLAQTFREPLTPAELATIERVVGAPIAWNHRGKHPRETFADHHALPASLEGEFTARELGVAYAIRARHRGQDPWLFLDLRAGRRVLRDACLGKSVLNLFAYTGAAGVAALVFGAREAWNVDFARSSLDVSRLHAARNDFAGRGLESRLVNVVEDVYPIVWQLAGLPVKGRARAREFTRVEPRSFDVVFLDPPAFSKGPFGAVDVQRDYPSLFKPALLCLAEGGVLIATNHVAAVEPAVWRDQLVRCADKAGRPLRSLEFVAPDADVPSYDGRPPLKIAVARV